MTKMSEPHVSVTIGRSPKLCSPGSKRHSEGRHSATERLRAYASAPDEMQSPHGIKPQVPDADLFLSDCEHLESETKSKLARPYVIGVCGGTASGKTTVCALFEEYLKDESVVFVPSDSFYKCLSPELRKKAANGDYDFDHPNSLDWEGVKECLRTLRRGRRAELPTYDFKTHSRTSAVTSLPPANVIILEGILIYSADQELRDMMDLKIFVDCDADVRLARRLTRDIAERGRDVDGVLTQYMKYVKPSYETFVDPSKRFADIIVPNLGNTINMVGVELLVQQIRHQLNCRRVLS